MSRVPVHASEHDVQQTPKKQRVIDLLKREATGGAMPEQCMHTATAAAASVHERMSSPEASLQRKRRSHHLATGGEALASALQGVGGALQGRAQADSFAVSSVLVRMSSTEPQRM